MKSIITIALLTFFLFGCNKVNLKKDFSEIKGDYEWIYSEKGISNVHAFDSEGDRYAIRIEDKRTLLIFKNGRKIEKYKLAGVSQSKSGDYSLRVETKYSDLYFRINGNELFTYATPFYEYENYFTKVK